MFFGTREKTSLPPVRNCQFASALKFESSTPLTVLASDLRGTRGRKIQFNTATGEVLVQRLA